MGVVFVAGVHGVGKTTTCASAANSLGVAHYSASGLINAERANAISQNGKTVVDIAGNQTLLIQGVKKARERHNGRLILDGHFTLLNSGGEIEALSLDVYRSLVLDGIVVYHDEPEAIAKRIMDRDQAISDPSAIDQHQRIELEQAHLVADGLNVPVRLLKAFDDSGLARLISEKWAVRITTQSKEPV